MPDRMVENIQTNVQGKSRRRHARRVLRCLAIVATIGLLVLGAFSYDFLRTLASLEKVDGFPLYRMQYRGTYLLNSLLEKGIDRPLFRGLFPAVNAGACTSFAARNARGSMLFGRNFDWSHRSSLLLYCDPPHGYASVSMVDLYYLGLEGMSEIPWTKRLPLLAAPHAAIDGMNEQGVVIAQNVAPRRQSPKDPHKPTLLSSQIVRRVLDRARDVNDAVSLIGRYNVESPGVSVHFHIADASGGIAVVEYGDNGIEIVRGESARISTNFLLSEERDPDCWRYREACGLIGNVRAGTSFVEAMRLLQATSQSNTIWSAVYNLTMGDIKLVMGRKYNQMHEFQLGMNHSE